MGAPVRLVNYRAALIVECRHPNLRYRVGDDRIEARLKGALIAYAERDGDWWGMRHTTWLDFSEPRWLDGQDKALRALVGWARPYAWKHNHKPLGHPIAKGLRRRPT